MHLAGWMGRPAEGRRWRPGLTRIAAKGRLVGRFWAADMIGWFGERVLREAAAVLWTAPVLDANNAGWGVEATGLRLGPGVSLGRCGRRWVFGGEAEVPLYELDGRDSVRRDRALGHLALFAWAC